MSSSEDKERDKPPDPPDRLDLGPEQSTQGSAGFNQQHNPDSSLATLVVSQPTTLVTTTVSQPSTTATSIVSQDSTMATAALSQTPVMTITAVSQTTTMATIVVSLQTTATSAVNQSTMGHPIVSPSIGDASHSASSISAAASELEDVLNQALPEGIANTTQDPVTGNIPVQDPPSNPQGSANPVTSVAQQLAATQSANNQLQVTAQIHAEDTTSQSAYSTLTVPGLAELSADEVQAITDSGVALTPDLGTALFDVIVGHQLSTLKLGKEPHSHSALGTGQFAVGPGPGSHTYGMGVPVHLWAGTGILTGSPGDLQFVRDTADLAWADLTHSSGHSRISGRKRGCMCSLRDRCRSLLHAGAGLHINLWE